MQAELGWSSPHMWLLFVRSKMDFLDQHVGWMVLFARMAKD